MIITYDRQNIFIVQATGQAYRKMYEYIYAKMFYEIDPRTSF
jgi:hypothetical protein